MIDRDSQAIITKMLNKFPSVAILGARQIGKTTLAFKIKEAFERSSLYLDLERPSDLTKLSDPEFFFKQHFDKLLILDEIQRAPHLLPILRSMIDERRRASDIAAQYLLLGSSSKMLLSQSSDSLAGRIGYTELPGLNLKEVGEENFNKLWIRGGFPQSYLDDDIHDSLLWRENLIKTYLEREVHLLGVNINMQIMGRFWGMLAHNHGELFNGAKMASSLGVSNPTVFKYLSILEDLFMVRILQPWHQNIGKRLVKSPKIYIRDSGLLHSLLGIKTLDDLLMHPVAGNSFEGFVIENIKSIMQPYQNMWFYRTSAGAELDLIIEDGTKRIGIEIKKSLSPSPSKGLYNAKQDLNLDIVYIIYPGSDTYALNEYIKVISLNQMMRHDLFNTT